MTLNSVGINKDLCYKDETGSDSRCKKGKDMPEVSSSATDMRVWWIPQVPGKPFHVPVKNENEAILVLDTLAKYDLFQFNNKIKGDYANAGGLEVLLDDSWNEWTDNDGDSIDEVIKAKKVPWIKS